MFIAVTREGKEYFYKTSTRIVVPKASATKIVNALNKAKYKLTEGEKWHIYETECMDVMYGRAFIRKNKLTIKWETSL